MDTIVILLVMFVLDGEASTFAVSTKSMTECMVLESKTVDILPQMLGRKPQAYAAKCAEVKPFVTAS